MMFSRTMGAVLALLVSACSSNSSGGLGASSGASGIGGTPEQGGPTGSGGMTGAGGLTVTGTGGVLSTGGIGGVSGTGIETGAGASAGPSFKEYSPSGNTAVQTVYSSNGTVVNSTDYFYVANVGGAGTATVSLSYQGYTETNDFLVEAGVQYVLMSNFVPFNGSATTTNCTLSLQLPGLTFARNMASTPTLNDPIGKCLKVGGPPTSLLVPLSSCSCSGGFSVGEFHFTNCGISDPSCCNSCPSGKTCNGGSCL